MNILVVEDDSSVRETLGMVLEAFDHKPTLVKDGEQALKTLREFWPDVMLLDLSLPGMNGEEVHQKILKEFERVPPTVILSAVHEGADRARHLQGAHFLAKPYTIEQLGEILFEAHRGGRGAA